MIDGNDSPTNPPAPDLKRARRQRPTTADSSRGDRLPPHSIEAEKGVLGCLLLAPKDGMGYCLEKFKRGGDVFYSPQHRTLFDEMVEMHDAVEPIDLVTLGQRLRDRGHLEAIGGYPFLSSLLDSVPSAANLEYYADIVRDKYILRKMIQTCTGFITRAYEEQGNVEGLMDEVERDVLRISEEREESKSESMKDMVHKAIEEIQEFNRRKGQLSGLGTGLKDLDKMTTGLQPGQMVVIAARPSMGKTSLAMNIAEYVAVESQLPVGIFSLEMTSESLVMRMLCSRARVNLRNVHEGFLAERDFPKLTTAASKLARAPIFIDDTPGLSILQLRARARRMWQQSGIKLFVIDYLQLLHSTAARSDQNRQQEISDISGGAKALAKELGVPVIVLSQLNREVERDKSRKPRLSDLRESGAIEQDADIVGLLYKADPGNPRKPAGSEEDDDGGGVDGDTLPVNLFIAKQRNGPTGDVHLTFFRTYTRFENASNLPDDVV
ncbi:MAG: replicative DNA helicase [Limisphaerales bacterium]